MTGGYPQRKVTAEHPIREESQCCHTATCTRRALAALAAIIAAGDSPCCALKAAMPGHTPAHEASGIRKSGKTRQGNKALGGALGIAAMSASRSKDSYLAARYRRIVSHRGKQRAIVAVEHSILTAVLRRITK